MHRVPLCLQWGLIRHRRALAGTPMNSIMSVVVAPDAASQRDVAVVPDEAAAPVVTPAAARADAQPLARRAVPADAQPRVPAAVHAARAAVLTPAERRAAPVQDVRLRRAKHAQSAGRVPAAKRSRSVERVRPAKHLLSAGRVLASEHSPSGEHVPLARRARPWAAHVGAAAPQSACLGARRSRRHR